MITKRHFFFIVFTLLFIVACTTQKDSFLSRNYHALTTRDNILYNGGIAFNKGEFEIKNKSQNNFWKRLPIEKIDFPEIKLSDTTNEPNFHLAENKAIKSIQKHSMNINGKERNSQIDDAYILLGKCRYYTQRFIPAMDAFNYILYKHPHSDKIHEAKVWREKTNIRLGNYEAAIKNIKRQLKDYKFYYKLSKQLQGDANAVLADAFLKLEEKDSAISRLKIAQKKTKINTEKARYRFIMGQLYEEMGKNDSALICFQSVINMHRRADRDYVIQAYLKKAQLFNFEKGNKKKLEKMFSKLIKNPENRIFLDIIYHNIGCYYEKNDDTELALKNYNLSIKNFKTDKYIAVSNYRNLGNMYFRKANYKLAAKYYDSTLVKLDKNTREYVKIEKARKNLDEVIKYDNLAHQKDSILNLVALSDSDRATFFGNYIEELKKTEEKKKIMAEKQKEVMENFENSGKGLPQGANFMPPRIPARTLPKLDEEKVICTFYFYIPTSVSFGQMEFKKTWGKRSSNGFWRTTTDSENSVGNSEIDENQIVVSEKSKELEIIPSKYSINYYLDQIPKDQKEIDSINQTRNFAYFKLGVVYKEKFKEYDLATNKFEKILEQQPSQKMLLQTLYNLYRIYQITDTQKAEEIKRKINQKFPDSRYANIVNNLDSANPNNDSPESTYNQIYCDFQEQQYTLVLEKLNLAIIQFSGNEIIPKFELLRAFTIAKLFGITEYKKSLKGVAEQYPEYEEGKQAQEILSNQIENLEKIDFSKPTKSWKLLYKVGLQNDPKTKEIEEKIKRIIEDRLIADCFYSFDVYTDKENFLVIHNLKSEEYIKVLLDYIELDQKYKINAQPIIISTENYRVIQIKKNLSTYLTP